jgi:hypothetical protein
MAWYRVDAAQVRDVTTGELRAELAGQQVTIVTRDTDTPFPIYNSIRDRIPNSRLTVSALFTIPSIHINVDAPADLYLDWLDSSGARGPVEFEAVLRDAALSAAASAAESGAAAEKARSFAAAGIRTIGGERPDPNGDFDPGVFGEASKESLGLGQVDNTRDEDKPVSKPQQLALDKKADDGKVVKTAGDQTIDGIKTFQKAPVVPNKSFTTEKVDGLKEALDARVVGPEGGLAIALPMSKAAYDALPTKDPKTIYLTWGG